MPPPARTRSNGASRTSLALRPYPAVTGVQVGRDLDAICDRDLLAAVLAMAEPDLDADAMAARLLTGKRSLVETVAAAMQGVGAAADLDSMTSIRLHALVELATRLVRPSLVQHPVFVEHAALVAYCRLRAASAPVQQVRLLFLDDRKSLIADEVHQTGTVDNVATYVREIMRRAIELGARGIVVAHSVPDEVPPKPFGARSACADIRRAGDALGVDLHEYLLIARHSYRCLVRERDDDHGC